MLEVPYVTRRYMQHVDGMYRYDYDFTRDGGAVGDNALGLVIPDKTILVGRGYINVTTPFTSGGSATVALKIQSSADLKSATAIASFTGLMDLELDGVASNGIVLTADRTLIVTVGTAALTAGACTIYLPVLDS